MSRRALNVTVICAAAIAGVVIGAGYAIAGAPAYLPLAAIIAAIWLATWWRGLSLAVDAGLVLALAAAAAGMILDAPAALMLAGAVAALAAWDLMRVDLRFRMFVRVERAAAIEHRELRWVAAAAGSGLALAALALAIQAQVSFTIMFVIALLTALALGQAIRMLRA